MPGSAKLKDFDASIEWFRSRVPMSDKDFDELSDNLKGQAFKIAGVTQLDIVSQVYSSLEEAIDDGATFEDWRKEVQDKLTSSWGGDDPYRMETIFRTWVQRSYAAGRYEMMTNPVVMKLRPFWQYVAIEDDATCPICDPIDGTTLAADDSFWGDHNPPMHFSCRCTVVTLTPEDAGEQGLTDEPTDTEALEGFGGPPDLDFDPDLSEYPPDVATAYERRRDEG